MRTVLSAAYLAVIAIVLAIVTVAQEPSGPQVTFTLTKSQFLSTETATGTLDILNSTEDELYFYTTSIFFRIRDAGGVRDQHWITAIGHVPVSFKIPPGEHQRLIVPLPGCEVLSDPCTEHVAIGLSLDALKGSHYPIVTGERSYSFYPDATATFRIDGLSQDRPLFITQGEARDTVLAGADDFAFDRVFSEARNNSKLTAEDLAQFSAAGSLSDARGVSGDDTRIQLRPRSDEESWEDVPVTSYWDFITKPSLRMPPGGQGQLVDVRVRSTTATVGTRSIRSASLIEPQLVGSGRLGYNLWELSPLVVRASMAADRPELYSIAAVSRQAAEQHGLDPNALAVVLAARRAQALARSLGGSAGSISMIAQYESFDRGSEDMVVPYGVAMTLEGEPSLSWHVVLAAPSPPPTPIVQGFIAYPSPRPMPIPTASYRFLFRTRASSQELVPIDVPAPENLVTVQSTLQLKRIADRVLVSIAFDRGDKTQEAALARLPNPISILGLVRDEPGVIEATAQNGQNDALPIGYLIEMQVDASRVAAVAKLVESQYRAFHLVARFGVTPGVADCDDEILRAQEASARAAVTEAVATAQAQGRRLRKLLLAAALAPDVGEACLPQADNSVFNHATEAMFKIPSALSVSFRVPVEVIFRTFPGTPSPSPKP